MPSDRRRFIVYVLSRKFLRELNFLPLLSLSASLLALNFFGAEELLRRQNPTLLLIVSLTALLILSRLISTLHHRSPITDLDFPHLVILALITQSSIVISTLLGGNSAVVLNSGWPFFFFSVSSILLLLKKPPQKVRGEDSWFKKIVLVYFGFLFFFEVSMGVVLALNLLAEVNFRKSLQVQRPDEALTNLEAAVSLDPFSDLYQRRLAAVEISESLRLLRRGREADRIEMERLIPDALNRLNRAAELNKLNGENYLALGDAYVELLGVVSDSGERALLSYRKALSLRPEDSNSRLKLAALLEKLGQKDRALREYQEVLKILEPSSPLRKRVTEKIRVL